MENLFDGDNLFKEIGRITKTDLIVRGILPNDENIDLFERPDLLPDPIRTILTKYQDAEGYHFCLSMLDELKTFGYSFEFGLDAVPFNLKKL
jgi:hypothetical protein